MSYKNQGTSEDDLLEHYDFLGIARHVYDFIEFLV